MKNIIDKDDHLHSPYCPHRHSDAPMEEYVAAAEKLGLRELTFIEHMCFPEGDIPYAANAKFPTVEGMREYFRGMREFRDSYTGPVNIRIGLEIDYLPGFEEGTKKLLEEFGPMMDDALLSVHFVPTDNGLVLVSAESTIGEAIEKAGGEERLYELYFKSMVEVLTADIGPHKPKKLTHPTVIRLLQKKYPGFAHREDLMEDFVKKAAEAGFALELNTQGLRKDECAEVFGEPLLPYIRKYDVAVVIASDAHKPEHIGNGFDHPAIAGNLDWLRRL